MTGVEILSSETIYNTMLPAAFAAIAFIGIFIFLLAVIFCLSEDRFGGCVICVGLMICSMADVIWSISDDKNSVAYIEYKVTIDESVSMTEFMDKYEIIDQEGKIYTVREKD